MLVISSGVYRWKDSLGEKPAFLGASQNENLSDIAQGKNSSIKAIAV